MRNIDKYQDPKSRIEAFKKFCDNNCGKCPLKSHSYHGDVECIIYWLERDNSEDELMPCPFCGGEVRLIQEQGIGYAVAGKKCNYLARWGETEAIAVAAHNHIASLVRSAGDGGEPLQ